MPYLYGGVPRGCKNCKSKEEVSTFCRFGLEGKGQCWGGRRERLVKFYLDRGFHEILTFTPCDLWNIIKGRTLYFSGDSQTQVKLLQWHQAETPSQSPELPMDLLISCFTP